MEWNLCSSSALTRLGSNYYLFCCDFHLGKKHSLLFSYTDNAPPQTFVLIALFSLFLLPSSWPHTFLLKQTPGCFSQANAVLFHPLPTLFPEQKKKKRGGGMSIEQGCPPNSFLASQHLATASFAKSFQNLLIRSLWLLIGHFSQDCATEGGNRTGSILKAGLHLGPDCGLWATCPVSTETT